MVSQRLPLTSPSHPFVTLGTPYNLSPSQPPRPHTIGTSKKRESRASKMSKNRSVPNSLRAFLNDGVEAAECSICTEPFDSTHVIIQIKECGHHFGKECLKNWLKQKDSKGTYPTYRGVLFAKKAKVRGESSTATAIPATRTQPKRWRGSMSTTSRSVTWSYSVARVCWTRFGFYFSQQEAVLQLSSLQSRLPSPIFSMRLTTSPPTRLPQRETC
jgi:hypothetical protein